MCDKNFFFNSSSEYDSINLAIIASVANNNTLLGVYDNTKHVLTV